MISIKVELPERIAYKEIALNMLDFVENFVTIEKIQKTLKTQDELNCLRKETFELNEQLTKLKKLQNENKYESLKHKFDELNKENQNLKYECNTFKEKISEIKNDMLKKNNSSNLEFENTNLKLNNLDLNQVDFVFFLF